MTSTPLFLDTSIQILRKGNDANEISKIDDAIGKHDFISTSSYVRLEFKQSYIQDLVYLHRNLVEQKSIIRVLQIGKGLTAHVGHIRKISAIFEALIGTFASIKSFHSDDNVDKDMAETIELYLETILEDIWEWFNKESVDHVSDATECIRSKESPKKKTLTFDVRVKKCKSKKIRCNLNKFFKEKEIEFKAIRDYINNLDDTKKHKPDELKKIAAIIDQGLVDADSLCNSSECRGLGDALVAVEGLHFKEIFTKDKDQAQVISKAINLKSSLLM